MQRRHLLVWTLAWAALAAPALARDSVGANEQVGGGGAPTQPADTRATTETPARPKPPEYKRLEEQARQQYLDWYDRVASLKEQWRQRGDAKSREAIGQLDQGLLTVKESWEKLRQDQTPANFGANHEHFQAALDRLRQTWQNDVAEAGPGDAPASGAPESR